MLDDFKQLEVDFRAARGGSQQATTLEEKRKLLELSVEIIKEANSKIAQFRAQIAAFIVKWTVRCTS
jgi:hypothetical protein